MFPIFKTFERLTSIYQPITDTVFIKDSKTLFITNNTSDITSIPFQTIKKEFHFKRSITAIIYNHITKKFILLTPCNALLITDLALDTISSLPKGYPYISPSANSPNHSLPITCVLFPKTTNSFESFITLAIDGSIRFWAIKEKRVTCLKTLILPSSLNNDYKFTKGISISFTKNQQKYKTEFEYIVLTEPGKLYLITHLTIANINKSTNNFIELFIDVKQKLNIHTETNFIGLLNVDNTYIIILEAESGTLIIIHILSFIQNDNNYIKTIQNDLLQINYPEYFKMDYINKEKYVVFLPLNNGCIGKVEISSDIEVSDLELINLKNKIDNVCIYCYNKEHLFVGNSKGDVYYGFTSTSLFKKKENKDEIITGSIIKNVGEFEKNINLKENTKKVKLSHKYGNLPIEKQLKPGHGKDNM